MTVAITPVWQWCNTRQSFDKANTVLHQLHRQTTIFRFNCFSEILQHGIHRRSSRGRAPHPIKGPTEINCGGPRRPQNGDGFFEVVAGTGRHHDAPGRRNTNRWSTSHRHRGDRFGHVPPVAQGKNGDIVGQSTLVEKLQLLSVNADGKHHRAAGAPSIRKRAAQWQTIKDCGISS